MHGKPKLQFRLGDQQILIHAYNYHSLFIISSLFDNKFVP